MKRKILFIAFAIIPLLASCNRQNSIQEEMKALAEIGDLPLTLTKEKCDYLYTYDYSNIYENIYESFHYRYSETAYGVDIYTCGVVNGGETRFYFRDGINVGFATRDPQFGFSILGRTIGSPVYGQRDEGYDKDLYTELMNRGFEEDFEMQNTLPSETPAWSIVRKNKPQYTTVRCMTYQEKLHINYCYDPIYSFRASMVGMEVFLEE